ncbi:MAG: hypothetical protein A4E65_02218 [Syntrophorhabdus sp. PtaU1.Bin153]|nr:MAG: hypothetical protein A4E65_02218 [Syntrophorhabdus sp. PtaU1.Bin153]
MTEPLADEMARSITAFGCRSMLKPSDNRVE